MMRPALILVRRALVVTTFYHFLAGSTSRLRSLSSSSSSYYYVVAFNVKYGPSRSPIVRPWHDDYTCHTTGQMIFPTSISRSCHPINNDATRRSSGRGDNKYTTMRMTHLLMEDDFLMRSPPKLPSESDGVSGEWVAEWIHSVPLLGDLAVSPYFWSVMIMSSIIALLYSWEKAIETTRERLPNTLLPVLDSILAEMGGLGFIGLFLGVFVTGGPLGTIVGGLSEYFLGDEEVLLETFEFLHSAFFEVAVAFFLVAGAVVGRLLNQVTELQECSIAVFDLNEDGGVTLNELATYMKVDAMQVDTNQDGLFDEMEIQTVLRSLPRPSVWDEAFMSTSEIRAETLVTRFRFLETCKFPNTFRIEDYFIPVFGERLREIVELTPLVWVPLIPVLSYERSIDMSRDVVSSSSANAYLSCGQFLNDPIFFSVSSFFAVFTLTWGLFNYWKMASIKQMLLPTLIKDCYAAGRIHSALLPPRYTDPELLEAFDSSPGIFGWIESLWATEKGVDSREVSTTGTSSSLSSYGSSENDGPTITNSVTSTTTSAAATTTAHKRLFGTIGEDGPDFYGTSIKYQIWLAVSQIVFWGFQIVQRDFQALLEDWSVPDTSLVQHELLVFGLYVGLALGQLALAPQTFLNYCSVTSTEGLTDYEILDSALYNAIQRETIDVVTTNGSTMSTTTTTNDLMGVEARMSSGG